MADFLPEHQLIWSPVVANSRMNRERNASGINSYEREIKFKPELFLASKINELGQAAWLDLCCGTGKALYQTANFFEKRQQQDKIQLLGIDLLDTFVRPPQHITCLQFKAMPLLDWTSPQRYDFITCIHGLHYVGDKLKVIEQAANSLQPTGLFIANLDFGNMVIQGSSKRHYLKYLFQSQGFNYNTRNKLLSYIKGSDVHFNLNYLGADDTHGPNYTGQDSVTSYYSL